MHPSGLAVSGAQLKPVCFCRLLTKAIGNAEAVIIAIGYGGLNPKGFEDVDLKACGPLSPAYLNDLLTTRVPVTARTTAS